MGKNEKQQERENLVGKRLAFFHSFLRANFITQKSIPKEIMPFATVNTNVFKDDMRLSAAFRVLGHYGYTLLIYIEPKEGINEQVENDVKQACTAFGMDETYRVKNLLAQLIKTYTITENKKKR